MVSFKKATDQDITLLQELAEKSWNSAYANILSTDQIEYMLTEMYAKDELFKQLQNPNYQYYLILSDVIPAGFIGFEFH